MEIRIKDLTKIFPGDARKKQSSEDDTDDNSSENDNTESDREATE